MPVIAPHNKVNYQKVVPAWDEVLVRVPVATPTKEGKTAGGIIIPAEAPSLKTDDHAAVIGEIVRCGPMAFQYQTDQGVELFGAGQGDTVMFRPYSGCVFSDPDDDSALYRLMPSRQIIALIQR